MPDEGGGPDFFCVGMQKTGTLWLYESLHQCPGFWMPPIKELHFFDRDFFESDARVTVDAGNLRRSREIVSGSPTGPLPRGLLYADPRNQKRDQHFAGAWIRMALNGYRLEDYRALFGAKDSSVSADVTPSYSALSVREIEPVRAAFPRLKIVIIVRDPIDRAWSSFNMYIRRQLMPGDKRTRGSFSRALEERATPEALGRFMSLHETRQRSFPSISFNRWVSVFGALQVHVTFFQDIFSRPAGVLEDICTFLDVDIGSPPVPAQNFKEKVPRAEMTDVHREFLYDYFREEYRVMLALFPDKTRKWLRVKPGTCPA